MWGDSFHHAKTSGDWLVRNYRSCRTHRHQFSCTDKTPPNNAPLGLASITMTSHRDGVNPLRPYYRPPSIGESPEPMSTPGPRPFSHGNATAGQYASKARDIFSDLDYKDYISEPSPSVVGNLKDLIDELLWRYTSVLLAQPFEVAKTVLQVRAQDDVGSLATLHAEEQKARTPSYRASIYDQVSGHGVVVTLPADCTLD